MPRKMEILLEPGNYFDLLEERCRNSRKRIVLSALYFGSGSLEVKLLDTIGKAMQLHEELQTVLILDYNRSHREKKSLQLLKGMVDNYGERFQVFFYRMPLTNNRLFGYQTNEILGVFHCKFCVIDDMAIITGANLNEEYFTTRQDRFVVFENSRRDYPNKLVQFLERFVEVLKPHLLTLNGEPTVYKRSMRSTGEFHQQLIDLCSDVVLVDERTVLLPLIQFKAVGVEIESRRLPSLINLISQIQGLSEFLITSPYPSFTHRFMTALNSVCEHLSSPLHIIVPAKSAHGFQKGTSGSYKSFIPLFHEQAFHDAMGLLRPPLNQMLEYGRPKWTYHAKGLWAFFRDDNEGKSQDHFQSRKMTENLISKWEGAKTLEKGSIDDILSRLKIASYIGSSNLGERSWTRDFELGFMVLSSDLVIRDKFRKETTNLLEHCCRIPLTTLPAPDTSKDPATIRVLKARASIKFFTRLLRTFL